MIAAIEDVAIKKFTCVLRGAAIEEWLFFFYCGTLLLRCPGRNRGGAPQLERFYTVPFKKSIFSFSAIKVAFRTVLDNFQADLIQKETDLQYNLQLSIGDQNYYLIVTFPTLICKLFNN